MKLKLLAVATCLSVTSTAHAQSSSGADFRSFLSGSGRPLTIRYKDLTPQYRRFSMSQQGDAFGNYMQSMLNRKGVETGIYFTTGETITVGEETYLVAYRGQAPTDLPRLMDHDHDHGDEVVPVKPAPTATLALSLLNLRNAGSLNDVRNFDPKRDMQTPTEGAAASLRTLVILARGVRTAVENNDGSVPAVGAAVTPQLWRAFYPHVHDERTWRNPMTNAYYTPNPAISGLVMDRVLNARYLPAFYEAETASDGTRGVAFLDGHAERLTAARWERISTVRPILKPLPKPQPKPSQSALNKAAMITPLIKTAIGANAALKGTNINVTIRDMSVSLDGRVKTAAQKTLAGDIARRNAPAFTIRNNLRVG